MKIKTRVGLLTSIVILLLTGFASNCNAQRPNTQRPNIILINFDDADSEMFELSFSDQLYPNIMGVASSGVTFNNLHVTTPLCGPSRACLYRGQYAHNTGIRVNDPFIRASHNFDGGMGLYRSEGYFQNDLSTWMKDAGYRTMLVGKFLHHDFQNIIPSGWDDFHSYLGGQYWATWRFTNEDNPNGAFDRLPLDAYRTTEETKDVVRVLERHAARGDNTPFFLNVNPYGPHRNVNDADTSDRLGMVDTSMLHWWPEMQAPFSPAFNEADTSDKRGYYRGLLPLRPDGLEFAKTQYRDRALALRSCDDMVGEIRETLSRLKMDSNTYILITSDNGFSLGHHRSFGKATSTDRNSRVPLLVIGPGVPAGRFANHLMAHIDLAPTIVDLAGGEAPAFVDGRSFAHLLTPTGIDVNPEFRDALLIENWQSFFVAGQPVESASTALRMPGSVYTEWANGEKDFFDLEHDPHQLHNIYENLHDSTKDFFAFRLRRLKNPTHKSEARFSVPFEFQEQLEEGQSLRGLAEDSQGVEQVRLSIYDMERDQFWNGIEWQTDFVQVNANLENPGGQLTFWNFDFMPVGENAAAGDILAWVWSFDKNFKHAQPSWALFRN